jgi:hypothetical protein
MLHHTYLLRSHTMSDFILVSILVLGFIGANLPFLS